MQSALLVMNATERRTTWRSLTTWKSNLAAESQ